MLNPVSKEEIEMADELMELIDRVVLDDFFGRHIEEEALEEKQVEIEVSRMELDHIFGALVESFGRSLSDPQGLIRAMVYWRILHKLTEEYDRYDEMMETFKEAQAMFEEEGEDMPMGIAFQ